MLRLVFCAFALFQCALPASAHEVELVDDFVTTQHEARIAGKLTPYTARAGRLPLYKDSTGELMGTIFVVAYSVEPKKGEGPRPITFIWNGGPGASSADLHLVAFGPKGLKTPETYGEWLDNPPCVLEDRDSSWLGTSDLVFIDPIGTGYSRATSEENKALLYTGHGDIEAVAEAIRVYRTRFDLWDQPMFIAGESYGTTRAMGVAEALERRRQHLQGVILISGDYEVGQNMAEGVNTAMQLPMFTATAYFHQRLPADLQAKGKPAAVAEATEWARTVYAPALGRKDQLSAEERENLLAGLARYSGVGAKAFDNERLSLSKDAFADLLLADQGLSLGHYDMRVAGPARASGTMWLPLHDPTINAMIDLMQGTSPVVLRYLRDELGYTSDLLYHGPFGEGFHPEPLVDVTQGAAGKLDGIYTDWMTIQFKMSQPKPGELPPLAKAMMRNPDLMVWNIRGEYDLSCASADAAVAATAEPMRWRVRNGCYPAGHMTYTDPAVRKQLQRDFVRFVSDALKGE